MIGDLILFFKEWWKQNVTCVHDYRYREIGGHSYKECSKCDRTKRE